MHYLSGLLSEFAGDWEQTIGWVEKGVGHNLIMITDTNWD